MARAVVSSLLCEQCNDLRTYQLVAPAEDEDIPD